ncbi:MAG TPA: hypothetical protein VHW71_13245 [Steroidobacteraceae bacterium]|nr:hypothetical protein [Steroidobacteraceae bacterium]
MHSIFIAAAGNTRALTQMIWLPGAYHHARHFLDAGFAQGVARRRMHMDLRFVDLEMQHLEDRQALRRLRSEFVLPAFESGASVWLGGISLGGMAALDYASCYLGELDGLCLLAPYLGNRMLIDEIAAQGLHAWEPGELAEADTERRIWRFIKTGAGARPLFLGFGSDDRFAAAHRLLATALPAERVKVADGAHDWRTWTGLWEDFLDLRVT